MGQYYYRESYESCKYIVSYYQSRHHNDGCSSFESVESTKACYKATKKRIKHCIELFKELKEDKTRRIRNSTKRKKENITNDLKNNIKQKYTELTGISVSKGHDLMLEKNEAARIIRHFKQKLIFRVFHEIKNNNQRILSFKSYLSRLTKDSYNEEIVREKYNELLEFLKTPQHNLNYYRNMFIEEIRALSHEGVKKHAENIILSAEDVSSEYKTQLDGLNIIYKKYRKKFLGIKPSRMDEVIVNKMTFYKLRLRVEPKSKHYLQMFNMYKELCANLNNFSVKDCDRYVKGL